MSFLRFHLNKITSIWHPDVILWSKLTTSLTKVLVIISCWLIIDFPSLLIDHWLPIFADWSLIGQSLSINLCCASKFHFQDLLINQSGHLSFNQSRNLSFNQSGHLSFSQSRHMSFNQSGHLSSYRVSDRQADWTRIAYWIMRNAVLPFFGIHLNRNMQIYK